MDVTGRELTPEEVVDGVASGDIQLLASKDVMTMIQVSRSTLDRWVDDPTKVDPPFPKPIMKFGRRNRWTKVQIINWLERCVKKAQER
jgi:predicted DNA-binding transcriptional regulator AlpA